MTQSRKWNTMEIKYDTSNNNLFIISTNNKTLLNLPIIFNLMNKY